MIILTLSESDAEPMRSILQKYSDQKVDLADACLMHLANREGSEHIFTMDRTHFSVFRPEKGVALTLPAK